ncbi:MULTISPECIES: hypothetical protein [Kitasatospora]|uniref:Secreted protein n=2 Tax=Kitasatospora TaxID=2063 RepID=A0ABT1ITF0_9ACTN|nr:hypothetical protein [Kitasatospora paracochleata]MCP2308415.1 hypothetical protein [Kitasatospora paracochleata]
MLKNRKAAALGVLVLAGSLLAAAPAQAASPSAKPTPTGDGAKAICKRLPKTQEHVGKALDRLGGDATVVGSVARLEQRVTNAKTAGHTEIQTYLNDRLTFRKSLVTTLQTRQNDLKAVATWCAAQGQSTGSGK